MKVFKIMFISEEKEEDDQEISGVVEGYEKIYNKI